MKDRKHDRTGEPKDDRQKGRAAHSQDDSHEDRQDGGEGRQADMMNERQA